MSLKFGLNIKQKSEPAKRTIFDEADDEDGEEEAALPQSASKKPGLNVHAGKITGPPNRLKKTNDDERQDATSMLASRKQVKAAEELDASIFDYDTFLEAKSSVTEAKKAAAKQDAIDRKPKYIDKLLDAAARRKQDQLVAQEKLLQREREEEGDEFADKEKFVTGAYKQQQAETAKLQEEERKRAEADEERQRRAGGGMRSFYKDMMDRSEKAHQEAIEAAAKYEKGDVTVEETKRSDVDLAAEMRAKGVNVHLNEDGQLVDKRELLVAGLNVAGAGNGTGADHLRSDTRKKSSFVKRDLAAERAQSERQRKVIEEQMEVAAKRKREASEERRIQEERAAKSTKTQQDVSDAKARYLARKAAKERGDG